MRSLKRRSNDDLSLISAEPQVGEVWWCEGRALQMNDGGKTRPVLLIAKGMVEVIVVPLTSRKPGRESIAVNHQGGLSWMTADRYAVPTTALLSSLGAWNGFAAWSRK